MDNREIKKRVYSMIIPIILENVLELSAGIISAGMIGRLDVTAISTQGVCARLIGILWCIFKGISIGATVLVARAYGANDDDKIRRVSEQTLLSSVIVAFICQFFLVWQSKALLSVFNPSPQIMKAAVVYLRIISWGLIFQAIMIAVTGILQGIGNAKTPMFISIIMNIVNIIVGYLLIFGNLGFSPLGLKGAAIATVAAQIVAALIGIYALYNNKILRFSEVFNLFRLDFKEIAAIFNVGVPSAFEALFWQFSAILLTRVMLSFGEVPFSAYQLGLQAEGISEMPALGFGVAATTFVGQSLGAMDKELGKRYIEVIKKGGLVVMSIGSVLLICFPHIIMRLLTNDKEVIELGAIYIRLMGIIQIPQNLSRVYNGALKGAGYTKIPMVVAGLGLWGVRIPLSLLLAYVFHMSIIYIWIIICVDQVFRFVLSVVLYRVKDIFGDKEVNV